MRHRVENFSGDGIIALRILLLPIISSLLITCFLPAHAAGEQKTVIEMWSTIQAPNPPELKPVKIDPKTTALLILDIEQRTTNMERRPRAVVSVPAIKKLLEQARENKMPVVFSTTRNASPDEILQEVTPHKDEPVVKSSVDKFFMTNLDEILKTRKISSVIIVGTAAEGAVVHTATAAAMRSLNVIVPVDCISSSTLYAEQYVCWHLLNAPGSRRNTTLTQTGLMEIQQ